MKTREAQALGRQIASSLQNNHLQDAYSTLAPTLAERTPFAMLRRIGAEIGDCPTPKLDGFLDRISKDRTEGGWVVIAGILATRLDQDLSGSLARGRRYIIEANIWYAADTIGEWVVGQALVSHFHPTLTQITLWQSDPNHWVRRALGTSVHFWTKRSKGDVGLSPQAESLLELLEPLFEERDMAALKGIAWGLKTLGRYYPELLTEWLIRQVVHLERPHRALMLRKALTFLDEEKRALVLMNEPT
jgi:3-methyladenine DNA glycosylase AlkD